MPRRVTLMLLGVMFMACASHPPPTPGAHASPRFSTTLLAVEAPSSSLHERVILKVSSILRMDPPAKITIRYRTQKQMREWYAESASRECASHYPPGHPARIGCRVDPDNLNVFIFGRWVDHDDDPGHLEIVLWEGASVEVVVHEYLHWWAYNHTDPKGVINSHNIVDPLVRQILTHRAFTSWLETQEAAAPHSAS